MAIPKVTAEAETGPLETAIAQFEAAAERLNLDRGLREVLGTCKRELASNFPVQMDDGSTKVFTGYRVQHNPAPDMGTDERIMAWIMDTISMHRGYTEAGVVTGKPVSVGGSLGRKEATGRGILYLIQQLCRDKGVTLAGATVAVQGFGNVGGVAATLLAQEGARTVAVSDSSGGLHNGKGLDVEALWARKNAGANLSDLKGGDRLSGEELLALPVDFLVPAALEGQISGAIARRVRARVIVEGANGPTTPDGDAVLADKGVLVVPDILANAGGIIVSYFEWVQDLQFFFWEEQEVCERLQRAITRAYREVCALAEKERVSLREAAMLLAVSRVEEATRVRGIYP